MYVCMRCNVYASRSLVLTAQFFESSAKKKRNVANHNKSGPIFEAITMFTLFDSVKRGVKNELN